MDIIGNKICTIHTFIIKIIINDEFTGISVSIYPGMNSKRDCAVFMVNPGLMKTFPRILAKAITTLYLWGYIHVYQSKLHTNEN